MNTIKSFFWFVVILGFAGIPAAAQRQQGGLTAAERTAALDTRLLTTCKEKPPGLAKVRAHNPQVFSTDRIERTLTGVWRGRVRGNYAKQFVAGDGNVNVDYYMIVDAKRGEILVFEQFGSKRSTPRPKAGTPTWSYVFCGRENYKPRHPAQVHTFEKVSDNLADARAILTTSTGLTFASGEFVLADVWKQLVDTRYFDDASRSLAFAGGFFKPFKIGSVPSGEGGVLLEMDMQAEYRGSGQTAARFQRGEPIRGFEKGKFLGVTTRSGDFLVASFALGLEVTVAKESEGGLISMKYDKIVIGPLAPGGTALLRNK
jgi:hypothetical protein